MGGNDNLRQRFYDFSLKIVNLVSKMPRDLAIHEIGKQLIRAGTSISANYEEATGAFSRDDFIYKMSISFKEAKESNYWLRILKDSELLKQNIDDLIKESEEIRNILGKSLATAKKKRE
jgi:four helix bundle protein